MLAVLPSADDRDRVRELREVFADPAAFRRWYDDAVRRVYRYLLTRCGGDSALAEELTQQAFINAIEHRDAYQGRSSAITWVCSIARNALIDHYRRLDREERGRLRMVVTELEPTAVDPGAILLEDRREVAAALAALPPLQRAAIVLRYLDGLPVREIAGQLGRSESATESLLSRARERLREILREEA
jgi:RNA polymerase sigma-70 factor (ECF subfamily)